MHSFAAVALLAGAVAAVPQYGGSQGGYGSPAAPSSEAPVYTTAVEYTTVQSCYGGCPTSSAYAAPTSTPVYGSSSEEAPSSAPCTDSSSAEAPSSTPVYGSPSSEAAPSSTPVYGSPSAEAPSSSAAAESSSPCPTGSTVTVTVSAAPYPTGPSQAPYQPTGTAAPTSKYPAPPTYTGAAGRTNAGLALAGVGAVAAFFF